MKKIDITGLLVGTLRVTGPAPNRGKKPYWRTHCIVCARDGEHRADTLAGANPTARCECSDARISHGATRKGGDGPDPLYGTWMSVKGRVARQSYGYELVMESDWRTRGTAFIAFREYILAELGPRPSKRHSLDRIDVTEGYTRGNLRWADDVTQGNNRTSTKIYECPEFSLALTAHEWSRFLNQITDTDRWDRADVQLFLDRLRLTPAQMIAAVMPPPPDWHHEAGKLALETLTREFDHQGWWDAERDDVVRFDPSTSGQNRRPQKKVIQTGVSQPAVGTSS